jgi:hypothetical protein
MQTIQPNTPYISQTLELRVMDERGYVRPGTKDDIERALPDMPVQLGSPSDLCTSCCRAASKTLTERGT